ncbi:MAG: hypothetical protein ABIC57_03620, partial [bacterium]
YETKYFIESYGMSSSMAMDLIYRGHRYLEERGYLDEFGAHIIVLDYQDTPSHRTGNSHEIDRFDQHEQRVTRYDEMILYSRVAKSLREKGISVYVLENGEGNNTLNQLGYTVSNLLSGLAHGLDPIMGFDIKLQKGHPFGESGIPNASLGEVSVWNGFLQATPRIWYENSPLQSES